MAPGRRASPPARERCGQSTLYRGGPINSCAGGARWAGSRPPMARAGPVRPGALQSAPGARRGRSSSAGAPRAPTATPTAFSAAGVAQRRPPGARGPTPATCAAHHQLCRRKLRGPSRTLPPSYLRLVTRVSAGISYGRSRGSEVGFPAGITCAGGWSLAVRVRRSGAQVVPN